MVAAKRRDGAWNHRNCSRAVQESGNRQAGMDTAMLASSGLSAGVTLKVKLFRVPASIVGVCPLAQGVAGEVVQSWSPCTREDW